VAAKLVNFFDISYVSPPFILLTGFNIVLVGTSGVPPVKTFAKMRSLSAK
jgi:hypothetical protein